MLIVAGTIDVDPDRRDEFLAGRRAGVLATRDETGCLEYAFSADLVEPGRVRIFERWENTQALAAHLAALAQAAPPAGGGVAVVGRDLVQYEISSSGPLGG